MLELSNVLQPNDLPGNEGHGDTSSLSEMQESEDNGSSSSEDDEGEEFGDDHRDWIDEMDLEAVYPDTETGVAWEDVETDQTPALNQAQQAEIERSQVSGLAPEVERFGGMAGKPIQTSGQTASGIYQGKTSQGDQPTNPYAPFSSQIDWEFAKWAKLRGPTSTAVTDLLNIPGVSPQVFLF